MQCPNCGKESNNIRVCAFCQAPYPVDGSGATKTASRHRVGTSPQTPKAKPSGKSAGGASGANGHGSRLKIWVAIGVLVAFTVGYYVVGRERSIPAGVVLPNLIAYAMSPTEAAGILSATNRATPVEERDGALIVRITKATFPDQRAGQLALAQQYARADEIVNGRKRAISFLDPDGREFAKADPEKGVLMTR